MPSHADTQTCKDLKDQLDEVNKQIEANERRIGWVERSFEKYWLKFDDPDIQASADRIAQSLVKLYKARNSLKATRDLLLELLLSEVCRPDTTSPPGPQPADDKEKKDGCKDFKAQAKETDKQIGKVQEQIGETEFALENDPIFDQFPTLSPKVEQSLQDYYEIRDALNLLKAGVQDVLQCESSDLFKPISSGTWLHNGPGDTTFLGCLTTEPARPGAPFSNILVKPDGSFVQVSGNLDGNGQAQLPSAINQYGKYTQYSAVSPAGEAIEFARETTKVTSKQGELECM